MASSPVVERATRYQTVSGAVVAAVADLTETDPIHLEPLYRAVDPDALDALFASTRPRGDRSPHVSFTYCECDVEIEGSAVTASHAGEETTKNWE